MLPHPSGTEPPPSLPPSTHSSSQTSTTRSSTTWPSWAVRTTSSSTSAVHHPSGRREQTSNRRTTILSHHRRAEAKARYPTNSFRSNYDYYDSSRYSGDYLYPVQHQVSHPVSCLLGHQSFWRKIWIFQFILFRKYDRNGLDFFMGGIWGISTFFGCSLERIGWPFEAFSSEFYSHAWLRHFRWWETGNTTTSAVKLWTRGTSEPPVLWSAENSPGNIVMTTCNMYRYLHNLMTT